MGPDSSGHARRFVVGERYPRRVLIGAVLGVLGSASGAFLLGMDVGLYRFVVGWIVIALGIALLGGLFGAGLLPSIGSIWLIALWLFVFPPLVGFLTGEWSTASRFTHPRLVGFGYTSARAELLGGLDHGMRVGLVVALLPGTVAYVAGMGITRIKRRLG